MDMNGLLIDYEWCTGCHTCEIACQQEHGFAPRNVLCDLCADRVEKGKLPTCVKHCQAGCMQYGSVEELSKKMTSKKMVLFV